MAEKDIKVYSTPTCPWCKKVKDYLTTKGVPYQEFNVAEDRTKLQEMVQLTGQRGVPVIVINDEVIVGFNQTKIDQLIAA
ncbi:MAG: glutaredoxin family protein [Armatimonadota bacterium]